MKRRRQVRSTVSGRGFTLVELMVVIAVILLIATVLLVSFGGVFSKRDEARATTTIETLKSNLESYQARYGGYPVSTVDTMAVQLRAPQLVEPNRTNRGIEALVLALRAGLQNGPYLDGELFADDEIRTNLDGDVVDDGGKLAIEGALDLFELVDPWGNPYVYLNINDVRSGLVEETLLLADGSEVALLVDELQAKLKHPTTGQYPAGYVLWSFGENGINEYGLGDDITSWPKYEE